MKKEINKGISSTKANSTNKARIRFQLGHTCGVTVFRVLEQEGIERGCGEIFKGSNGWKVKSKGAPYIYKNYKEVQIQGRFDSSDKDSCIVEDSNKETYNNILEIFKELGFLGNTPPKEGDRVLVKDNDEDEWKEGIYIGSLGSNCISKHFVVQGAFEESYIRGEEYMWCSWKQMKPIHENTFQEIREGILGEDLGTVFEVEFCLDNLGNNVQN